MRKEQLALLGKDALFLLRALFVGKELDVAQGKPGKRVRPRLHRLDGHEGGQGIGERVPRLLRHEVSVAGGAGGGVAEAAGGEDHRVRLECFTVFQNYAHGAPALCQQTGNARVQTHRHAKARKFARERASHVAGLVRSGEDALAALCLQRQPEALHQLHGAKVVQRRQRRVQKARVAQYVAHELILLAGVGEVAATFAGDVDLFAQLFVALQQRDLRAAARGKQRGHQSSRAAANDQNMFLHVILRSWQDRRRNWPRSFPAPQSARRPPAAAAG